jgi:hydroxyacyl-ACP dehydratase HTD2-like protein with hotdog domain
MLSVLRSQLNQGEMIMKFDYRNLAALFANEEMKICARKDQEREGRFDVWIEGREGGYAAKGTAVVGKRDAKTQDVE